DRARVARAARLHGGGGARSLREASGRPPMRAPAPRWRIELLGGVRATREAWTVSRFRTHKAEALLGYLAVHCSRPRPRELLTGHYQDWIEPERDRLRRAIVGAARELASALAGGGELARAVGALGRALQADPLAEEACRELMALHAAAGEPGAALRRYHEL